MTYHIYRTTCTLFLCHFSPQCENNINSIQGRGVGKVVVIVENDSENYYYVSRPGTLPHSLNSGQNLNLAFQFSEATIKLPNAASVLVRKHSVHVWGAFKLLGFSQEIVSRVVSRLGRNFKSRKASQMHRALTKNGRDAETLAVPIIVHESINPLRQRRTEWFLRLRRSCSKYKQGDPEEDLE